MARKKKGRGVAPASPGRPLLEPSWTRIERSGGRNVRHGRRGAFLFPAPPRMRVRRERRALERHVVRLGGQVLTWPSARGLLRTVVVATPALAVARARRTLRRLRHEIGRLFAPKATLASALAGLAPGSVLLLVRFGALGDLVQMRAALAIAVKRLGATAPRIWLKTRTPYVSTFRGRGVFDRVQGRWPALGSIGRALLLDSVVEADHSGLPEYQRHRGHLWYSALQVG